MNVMRRAMTKAALRSLAVHMGFCLRRLAIELFVPSFPVRRLRSTHLRSVRTEPLGTGKEDFVKGELVGVSTGA